MKTFQSKYKGYCSTCCYTVWKNEYINWNGKAHHLDCIVALKDATPRVLNPQYLDRFGKVDKSKLVKLLSEAGDKSPDVTTSRKNNEAKVKK